jgi:Flp pilus assembly protein TadG
MRVRRYSLVRVRDEEHGATLAIVAISLICLLGMLVLTFDLGRGVALKRNMVNGADAAALAAARECGLARGEAAARQEATDLLADNNGSATVTGFQINPGPAQCAGVPSSSPDDPTVTVTVTVPQDYFFAPIFGINNGTVVASATAEWTLGVKNPVPLKLDQLKVEECNDGHQTGYTGTECYFAFEKSRSASEWGWLDFPQGWPIKGQDTNPMDCTNQKGGSSDLKDYIDNMGLEGAASFGPVLWNPPPTYACAQGGLNGDSVIAVVNWLNKVADMDPPPKVYFPEVACNGTAAPCFPWMKQKGLSYPVVEFVGMRVVGAWKNQEARKHCTFTRQSSNVFCVQLAVAGPDDPALGGGVIVRLVD